MITCILLAGGKGTRTGLDTPKQFIPVAGKPLFTYSASILNNCPDIESIIMVCPTEWQIFAKEWITELTLTKLTHFAPPGKSRQHSILNGLLEAETFMKPGDTIMIHDAARPIINQTVLTDLISMARESGSSIPIIPIHDAVYIGESDGTVIGNVTMKYKYRGQAPVCLDFETYLKVNKSASEEELTTAKGTCSLMFLHGYKINTIPGDESALKVTTEEGFQKFAQILNG